MNSIQRTVAVAKTREACIDAILSESPLVDVVNCILAAQTAGGITKGEAEQMVAMAKSVR